MLSSRIEEAYQARRYGLTDTAWMQMTKAVGMKEFLLMDEGMREETARLYSGEPLAPKRRRHANKKWRPKPGPPKKEPANDLPVNSWLRFLLQYQTTRRAANTPIRREITTGQR